ncbi:helix-turn-helix domain-containing protein [Kitasatospora paracochleata]|uniref:helix-turn-helix domain-containing protein n=1 Tax=Kitasatospora paracochleata TaxID=58354 RepID=UPI003899138C
MRPSRGQEGGEVRGRTTRDRGAGSSGSAPRFATLRERDLGIREIAEHLGRAASTVSRDLRRNTLAHDQGIYDADLAHHRAEVQAKLDLEWSPE